MERNYKPIDWSKLPSKEQWTSFGDTNGNKLDIAIDNIDQRVITPESSKLIMPTPEETQEYGKANWENYPPNQTPI